MCLLGQTEGDKGLGTRSFKEGVVSVHQHLKGRCKEDRALFSGAQCQDERKREQSETEEGPSAITKHFSTAVCPEMLCCLPSEHSLLKKGRGSG